MEKEYYYPELKITEKYEEVEYYTKVRKNHEGLWYTCEIKMSAKNPSDDFFRINLLNSFHTEIYRFIILGIINPELEYQNGIKLFVKDDLQISEEERLKTKYK